MADSRSESMSTVYELSEDIVHRNVEKSNVSSSTPSNIDRLSASFEPAYFNIETDEQSPYEEVAANVSNKDDRDMPCLTLRSWIISLLFTCLLSFVNQFFWYRTSPLFVGVIVAQLLSHLLGKIMAKVLPRRTFKVWRWGFCLNPGPFTIKEHCIITAMASAAGGTAYAIGVITIKRLFYKRSINYGVGILFVITSHTLGYGMAGIMRRFLVWPAAMIWPANLISCALFRTLHSGNDDNMQEENNNSRWTMSRFRFFFLAFLCQFLWYWFPGYIFPILSLFSWICVIKPDNILLSQLTGVNGLGLGSLELDWNAWVSFLGSPIIVPFWAQINIMIGFVILAWIMTPAAYYTNLWGAKAFPMVSTRVFTEDGYCYNIKSVLNSQNRLNETAYNTYGEMRMTVIFAFSYGASFAAIAAVIVHTILFNGKTIVKQFRSSLKNTNEDIHAKLMSYYSDAPEWWYIILFVVAFVIAALVCHFGELMPWYFLFLAVASAFLLLLPTGIVLAVSNQGIGLNVIAEFIAGVAIPGDPLANVTFKTYGYITQAQALTLISDLKLGHYMKIPPRAMFITQLVGTIIAGIINYATADYLMTTIPNICTERNLRWTCPNANTFYSASIIWGAIGPVKMFGKGSTYSSLLYAFLIGAFLPIPVWFLLRKFPNAAWLKHVHFPIMLSATAMMPPAPPGNYPSWLFVGFFFNFVLVRYAHSWWKRYAYVFSAAMDCGVAICGLVIFFALQHNEIEFPTWWGTGGDTGDGCPLSHANYSGILPSSRSTVSD
ncbi:unnamed protein product [Rotaria socialis]|uniref:Oligopeptide transporter n=4 Tax=Rotaria socialis TaxID=392032 RepID=A0A818H0A9_9BILA|nr:unnamed protein product [Rotaria socialis]CAF3300374.1 unnamed protein product [Rotaria socialis]CAF3500603.1 unnamed protein product [Rotaria socialis]CAF4189254.1 unnamed protein product [Rotaria socialis]CAF4458673.1 unnamed protein product [Rotaria socialis]